MNTKEGNKKGNDICLLCKQWKQISIAPTTDNINDDIDTELDIDIGFCDDERSDHFMHILHSKHPSCIFYKRGCGDINDWIK